jgi:hypothetical protein
MYSIISWLVGFALSIPAGGLGVLYRNSPGSLTWREVAARPNV